MRYFVLEEERLNMEFEQKEKRQVTVCISLPMYFLNWIDAKRGEIPRSAYIRKKLMAIADNETEKAGKNGTFNY